MGSCKWVCLFVWTGRNCSHKLMHIIFAPLEMSLGQLVLESHPSQGIMGLTWIETIRRGCLGPFLSPVFLTMESFYFLLAERQTYEGEVHLLKRVARIILYPPLLFTSYTELCREVLSLINIPPCHTALWFNQMWQAARECHPHATLTIQPISS